MEAHVASTALGLTCPLLLWCCVARAQQSGASVPPPSESTAAETPAEVSTRSVEESELPFYLRDKDGKLVLMPGWTFEQFEELYQQSQGLSQGEQAPRYSLQSISATGIAKADHAEVTLRLTVLFRDAGWVRVPLGLEQAVLDGDVSYDGPGRPLLYFEENKQGYVALIEGIAGKQHGMSFNLLVPLSRVGQETQLKLSAPRAVNSNLKLSVPVEEAVGQVSAGAVLLATGPAGAGTTQFEVQGLGGDFELRWRKAGRPPANVQPVLEAVGDILVRIDNQTVHTEATLSVHGHGRSFDRFHVRLPKDAELAPGHATEFSVVPVSPGADEPTDRRVVEIRLSEKTTGPVDVSLATRQSLDPVGPTEWFRLGGFEVIEAARQWGQIGVRVVGDLYVFWGANRDVEQTTPLPAPPGEGELVASFKYFKQPFLLSARVAPKTTRLSVEPQYVLLVDEDQVRLEATLKYTVRGAKVSYLEVEFAPGWQVDEAGPSEAVVATGGVAAAPDGLVSIALSQPVIGPFEVTILAHQPIEPGSSSLVLPLPRPHADSLGPAAVAVLPADNVELTPNDAEMVGLIGQQVALPMDLPSRHQSPLFYRAETAQALFAAEMSLHELSITAQATTHISLLPEEEQVRQSFEYNIAYGRVQALRIDVPRSLAGLQGVEVFLDGQPASLAASPEQMPTSRGDGPVPKRVLLPEPRIGRCELTVRYPIQIDALEPDASVLCNVPLVMPGDAALSGNRLFVTADRAVHVHLRQGPWNVMEEETVAAVDHTVLELAAADPVGEVTLGLSLHDRDASGSIVVEQAWVQTVMLPDLRQDRAVFRFTSTQKSVQLTVPDGVELNHMEVELDGNRVEPEQTSAKKLVVRLPEHADRRWLLEVWYQLAHPRSRPGLLPVELPRLGPDVWVRRTYWQLVLPENEHVIVGPESLTPEFHWGWTGVFWGRVPTREQEALEAWCGAPHRTPIPTATSRYLFSQWGAIEQSRLRTANRSVIVLAASAVTLLVGFSLIYLPVSRRPGSLLIAAVVLLAAAVTYPAPALLALEAASLGVGLALLGGLLRRSLSRRRRGMWGAEPSSFIFDRGSTRTVLSPLAAGSKEPTHAPPAPASLSSVDSE